MFARYTEDARKVVFFARYEASRMGSPMLQPEHLWLGLLRQNKRLVRRLAPQMTADAIQKRLVPEGVQAQRISLAVDLPLSEANQRALAAATAEADRCRSQWVTSEHLVQALLSLEPATGAR